MRLQQWIPDIISTGAVFGYKCVMTAHSIALHAWLYLHVLVGIAPGQASARDIVSRVEFQHGALTIDHSQNIVQITQAQARKGQPATYGLGLFINNLKLEVNAGENSTRPGSISVLTRITTSPTIYVALEFPKDSCAYAVILEHERQHYLFDLNILRSLPADIERIAEESYAAGGINAGATRHVIERAEHAYAARSFAQHTAIDNLISYNDLAGACGGAIREHLKSIGK
jgi:hypothetical protein